MNWSGLAWLVMYGLSAARTITGFGDSDELIAAGYNLSLAHPPGYPLLTLILAGITHLPGLSPAGWSHLWAAVIMAVVVGLVVEKAAKKDWRLGLLAGLIVGSSRLIWEHGVHLEVFGLLGLWSVLLTKRSLESKWDLWWGVIAGLGLGHHQLFILVLLPQLVWGWRQINKKMILGLGTGLLFSLLLLLIIGSRQALDSWQFEPTLPGLTKFYFRQDYSGYSMEVGVMKAFVSDVSVKAIWQAWGFYLHSMWNYWGIWLSLGLIGLVTSKDKLIKWIAGLTGPGLASYVGVAVGTLGQATIERMYVLGQIWWGVLTVEGLIWLAERIRLKRWQLMSLGMVAGWLIVIFPSRSLANYTAFEKYVANLFQDLPPNSHLICLSDMSCFGSYYWQTVKGERQDVKVMANAPQFRYRRQAAWDFGGYRYLDNPFRVGEMVGRLTGANEAVYVAQLNQVWTTTLGLNGEAFDLVADGYRLKIVRQAGGPSQGGDKLEVTGPDYTYVRVLREVAAEQEQINRYLNQRPVITGDRDVALNFRANTSQATGEIKEELRLRQLALWRKPDDVVTRFLLADAFSRAGLKDLSDREYEIIKTLGK